MGNIISEHQEFNFLKKSNILLCIDDIHPEYGTTYDFGLLEKNSKLNKLINLAKENSWLKIILFLVPNWQYKGKSSCWTNNYYSIIEHKQWCEKLKYLMPENVSLGLHGFTHFNSKCKDKWKEFYRLKDDDIRRKLEQMIIYFEKAGLPYRNVFRPPGWEFSSKSYKILNEFGIYHYLGNYDIKTLPAPNSKSNQFGVENCNLIQPSKIESTYIFPANYDIGWSSDFRMLDLLSLGSFIGMTGHISNEYFEYYIGSGLEPNVFTRLKENLCYLRNLYLNKSIDSIWPDLML